MHSVPMVLPEKSLLKKPEVSEVKFTSELKLFENVLGTHGC